MSRLKEGSKVRKREKATLCQQQPQAGEVKLKGKRGGEGSGNGRVKNDIIGKGCGVEVLG